MPSCPCQSPPSVRPKGLAHQGARVPLLSPPSVASAIKRRSDSHPRVIQCINADPSFTHDPTVWVASLAFAVSASPPGIDPLDCWPLDQSRERILPPIPVLKAKTSMPRSSYAAWRIERARRAAVASEHSVFLIDRNLSPEWIADAVAAWRHNAAISPRARTSYGAKSRTTHLQHCGKLIGSIWRGGGRSELRADVRPVRRSPRMNAMQISALLSRVAPATPCAVREASMPRMMRGGHREDTDPEAELDGENCESYVIDSGEHRSPGMIAASPGRSGGGMVLRGVRAYIYCK